MITAFILSAFAAVWGWFVLNDPKSPWFIRAIARTLRRLPSGDKLVGCPWCIGAWLAIGSTVVLHWAMGLLDWVGTPVAAIAAAGLTGFLTSFMPDNGEPS